MDSLAYPPVAPTQPVTTPAEPVAPTAPPVPESLIKPATKVPVPATVAESEVCDESASGSQSYGTPRDPNYWRPGLTTILVIYICVTL